MKVNRVFCYSKEIAMHNGNKLPILQLILSIIVFAVVIVAASVILKGNMLLIVLVMIALWAYVLYYTVTLGIKLRTRMTGWATTDDGRIFKAMVIHTGYFLLFAGASAGDMVDQLTGSSNKLGERLGRIAGGAAGLYSMNKSAQYMSHPEIVAKMVEEAPNITGAEVIEILKVYSITEKKHSFKVICDYKVLRMDKVKYNKKMSIEKSYNQFYDLMNLISTHR